MLNCCSGFLMCLKNLSKAVMLSTGLTIFLSDENQSADCRWVRTTMCIPTIHEIFTCSK